MRATGISNRETPQEEAAERREHPPIDESSPPAEDVAGNAGDDQQVDDRDRQTSRKAGIRSSAQKEAEARYPHGPMPATGKVEGAFGREPNNSSRRKS